MLATVTRDRARLRALLIGAGSVVALLVLTQFVMPGTQGPGRGTPAALTFRGLINGVLIAITAIGIVMIYRSLRIVNFAQGPIGAVGGSFAFLLIVLTDTPFVLAVVAGIALSALLGAVLGVFTLRFFNSSRLFLTVVTIVASGVMFFVIGLLIQLPLFPRANELTTSQISPDPEEFRRLLPFAGLRFQVGKFEVPFGFAELFAIELGVIALLAIWAFFRYTKAGIAVRAMSENSERASLLGIGVGGLSVVVWTVAGALAGAGQTVALFLAFAGGGGSAQGGGGGDPNEQAFTALLPVLAAAVVGGFVRFGPTVFAALMIGVAKQAWEWSFVEDVTLFNVGLFVVILVGLLFHRRRESRSEAAEVSWSATDEPRPVPHELASITSLRLARVALVALAIAVVVIYPFVVSDGYVLLAGVVVLNAIAVLSLVVLTGWAGQVSLGQYAFVAVGSVVGGSLTSRAGVPFWLAVPVAAVIGAAVATLVGLPALRIKGLFLMVTTFGFAVAVQEILFDDRYFGWLLPEAVERPTLFFLDFQDSTSMYFLTVAALVASLVVVRNLRRSRVGRILIATRENEPNVQGFGISVVRAKLTAFAISGALCGFAGAIYAHQQLGVAQESFTSAASVYIFLQGVIGGVSSPLGALLGSAYFTLIGDFLPDNPVVQAVFRGGGPLLVLFAAPGGLVSLVNSLRDSVLRIVAQRRQIVVPSLFADYDPELLERRLIPLAEPDHASGLAALPAGQRFALVSELYQGRGERIIERLGPAKEAREQLALMAAVRSVEDLPELNGDTEPEPAGAGSEATP